MSVVGWVLLGAFLTLLVVGVGGAIWAGARPVEASGGRAGLLAVSGSVALAGLIGAIVVASWAPGSGGMHGMMGGDMAGMMGGSSSGSCPSREQGPSSALIEGFRFCPADLRVKVGTVVRWTNGDSAPHTVTARQAGEFDSGNLTQGRSWSHRFDRADTYRYYCSLHPWMEGTIEVTR
jgi:plastocyanin